MLCSKIIVICVLLNVCSWPVSVTWCCLFWSSLLQLSLLLLFFNLLPLYQNHEVIIVLKLPFVNICGLVSVTGKWIAPPLLGAFRHFDCHGAVHGSAIYSFWVTKGQRGKEGKQKQTKQMMLTGSVLVLFWQPDFISWFLHGYIVTDQNHKSLQIICLY